MTQERPKTLHEEFPPSSLMCKRVGNTKNMTAQITPEAHKVLVAYGEKMGWTPSATLSYAAGVLATMIERENADNA